MKKTYKNMANKLKDIDTLDKYSKNFSLSDVMSMLPTVKEAEKYVNGYFGYADDYEDSRVISASEQAFVSCCDWMRSEIERKLKGCCLVK